MQAKESSADTRIEPLTDNLPQKITAHAVRGLRPCFHCKGVGHKDHMILGTKGHDGGEFFHTVCYVSRYGFETTLEQLSARNLGMFRLCDLTMAQMQKLSKVRQWKLKRESSPKESL